MSKNIGPLKGKTALVTGAAKRIGRAIACALAENQINVIIHYSSSKEKAADEVATHVKTLGVNSWKFQADFSNIDNVDAMFEKILNNVGPVDFLINNAAIFPRSKLTELTIQELNHTLTINSIAPFRLSQHLARQKQEGCIINILDSRIKRYDMGHVAYQLSKNMLYHMTEMMALEFAPHVRVNGIAPDLILPPEGKDESYLQQQSYRNMMQRSGKISDIADTVLFLLSNTYITGEVIFMDGGQKLKGKSL